jgi:hypothetical protein
LAYLSLRLSEKPLISGSMMTVDLPIIAAGNRFFGSNAILRSLVLFNLLFAMRPGGAGEQSDGTGMGLRIVQAMLRAHGLLIRLPSPEVGAGFEIRLPKA